MKTNSYSKYIFAFILLLTLVVSLSVVALSNRTDTVETRIDSLEQHAININRQLWK